MILNNTATLVSVSIAGVFSFLSIFLTIFLIYRHLKHWTHPEGQTYIVRILLMVPVYSLSSFLSLLLSEHTIYFNLVRDCYEAFVLYQFFSLLVYYFDSVMRDRVDEDDDATTGDYLRYIPAFYHPFPCCCLPEIIPGHSFLRWVKQCVLQYVLVKPLLSLIAIVLELNGVYGEGSTELGKGYLWITLIMNLSITLSLYSLLLFYDTIAEFVEKEYRPLHQLLAIKILIFFIFWQTLAIDTLYYFGLMPGFFAIAGHDILSNCLVCLEMFLLSLANLWIFHYASYRSIREDGGNTLGQALRNLTGQIFNPTDIIDDAKDVFFSPPPHHYQSKEKL